MDTLPKSGLETPTSSIPSTHRFSITANAAPMGIEAGAIRTHGAVTTGAQGRVRAAAPDAEASRTNATTRCRRCMARL
ncbi:hypothetical protein GCM10027188_25540 [Lysobacter humi (ex Lee et al. 2017)]